MLFLKVTVQNLNMSYVKFDKLYDNPCDEKPLMVPVCVKPQVVYILVKMYSPDL